MAVTSNSILSSFLFLMLLSSTIAQTDDFCKEGGACGFNSYCRLGSCYCPDGYTFIDPNDKMQGCKPSFEAQSCDEDSSSTADLFDIKSMAGINWPQNDYAYSQGVTEEWCRKACLSDCFCALAIYNDNRGCWKKRFPFSNGRIDTSVGTRALIKVRKDNSASSPRGSTESTRKDHPPTKLVIGFLSSSVFLNVILLVCSLVLFYFSRKAKLTQPNGVMSDMNLRSFTYEELDMSLRSFAYEELDKATTGFKEQLGRGAFGTVFKGVLPFGKRNLVAVKKLENMMKEGDCEFRAEVRTIGSTNHKNLVKLIGFCHEGQNRLLVYEFMSNGSLSSFLFETTLRPNWHHRLQIALGISRGLCYLHEDCSTQIIHCDIKPQNILLDDYFTARISDFGLAKILKTDQSRTTTGIRGTKGYVAPEWFKNMAVTAKVDVYSYGILLLELICCRKNFEPEAEDSAQMILADWAYDCYVGGKLDFLVNDDYEAMEDIKQVENYVMVALWCIQEDPALRPTMKKVVQMLEGTITVTDPPDQTSFISSL